MQAADKMELLEELELNVPAQVTEVRQKDTLEVRASILIEAGNASDRQRLGVWKGSTRELSRLSMKAVLAQPIAVGDIYRVSADCGVLDLGPTYVLCNRCRLLQDDAYEASLTFFAPIELPA